MTDANLAAAVVARLDEDRELATEHFQAIFAAVVRRYSRASEATPGHVVPYSAQDRVRPTDALRAAGGLLRESDISSFELAVVLNL